MLTPVGARGVDVYCLYFYRLLNRALYTLFLSSVLNYFKEKLLGYLIFSLEIWFIVKMNCFITFFCNNQFSNICFFKTKSLNILLVQTKFSAFNAISDFLLKSLQLLCCYRVIRIEVLKMQM
jgi:hypothetical protein